MEPCTIIVNARDRFSPTTRCLDTLFANTPAGHQVIGVFGGAPERLRREWTQRFGDRVTWLFRPDFMNQAQARNLALREVKTRLAVTIDNDNYVRPGWLEPLIRCQQETGAMMVVPIILETERHIHTAGNRLYITYEGGRAYGHKELCFHRMVFGERTNLKRERIDYGELHCQLLEVEPTLRLGAFDEGLREVGEVDFGLTAAKAGRQSYFEPASVVYYALRSPIEAEDIRLFSWRWDMRGIWEGYRHFDEKWGIDITEHGGFKDFLLHYNGQLGLIPRLWPTRAALIADRWLRRLRAELIRPFEIPSALMRRLKARQLGYHAWPNVSP